MQHSAAAATGNGMPGKVFPHHPCSAQVETRTVLNSSGPSTLISLLTLIGFSLKPFQVSGANLNKLIRNATNTSHKGREGPSCLCKLPVTFSECHKRPYAISEWFLAMFVTEDYSGHKWKVLCLHLCICQPARPALLLVDAV